VDYDTDIDLIVLGSGGAGLTAALTASMAGLRPLVVEHQSQIGGTTARSSGTVWVPDNHYMRAAGIDDDRDQAALYLESLIGNRGDRAMWERCLDAAPHMLTALEACPEIGFRPYMTAPDYRQDQPGAAAGGRPLEPMPFDGRRLGDGFRRIATPIPELMLFGGMMVTRGEAFELLRADRSLKAAWLGLRLVGRYFRDRLSQARGTRLVLGNALIARLFQALRARGVPVLTDAQVTALVETDGRVRGCELIHDGRTLTLEAPRGVVLAGGGFPGSQAWREKHLPQPVAAHTPAAPGADGSTLALALGVGAALGPDGLDNALWFPSSLATRADGSTAVYPHIILDRSKPGLIAVDGSGRRFTNEAVSYHEFVRAMYQANRRSPAIPAWLICDSTFIRRYGLGMVRPRALSLRKHLDSGYMRSATDIAGLAAGLDLPPAALAETVARFNGFASAGVDEDFHKGENIYDRNNGDPTIGPNPCLGPIARPPFYAVAVWPTPLGTNRGLLADSDARVLSEDGAPIPGLYVCGNDMQSAFGGEYPGAGAQLGQAMTFAWIAARHAANGATGNQEPN
jgi:3-oxosteroid 1-dehydrogenase